MAMRLSALCTSRPLPPGRFLVLNSVRTRDLPAFNIAPQPTTLLRAPHAEGTQFSKLEYLLPLLIMLIPLSYEYKRSISGARYIKVILTRGFIPLASISSIRLL
jgi:hypothetical protein